MTDSVHGDVDRVVAALGGTKFPYHTFGRFRLRRRWTVAPAARTVDPTPVVEPTSTVALLSVDPPAALLKAPLWQEAMSWPEPPAPLPAAPEAVPPPPPDAEAVAPTIDALPEVLDRIEPVAVDAIRAEDRPEPAEPAPTPIIEPAIVEPAIVEPAIVGPAIIEPAVIGAAMVEAAMVEVPAPMLDPAPVETPPPRPRPPLLTMAALPGLWDDRTEPALLADVPAPLAAAAPPRGPETRANIFQLAWKTAEAAEGAGPGIPSLGAREVALPGESELFRRI